MELQTRLTSLEGKLRKFTNEKTLLVEKNAQLDKEVERLKQLLAEEQQKSAELVNKIKIIKLARNIGGGGEDNTEVTELKRKINEYIKEIDYCISKLDEWDGGG